MCTTDTLVVLYQNPLILHLYFTDAQLAPLMFCLCFANASLHSCYIDASLIFPLCTNVPNYCVPKYHQLFIDALLIFYQLFTNAPQMYHQLFGDALPKLKQYFSNSPLMHKQCLAHVLVMLNQCFTDAPPIYKQYFTNALPMLNQYFSNAPLIY
jgi:hypothetical protein